jgi:methylmalonyl-CoA mutase
LRKRKRNLLRKRIRKTKIQGELPEGNNGLGLMLLGVTGDQVLPKEIYNESK